MRIQFSELSLERIFKALGRRILAVPYKLSWSFSAEGRQNREKIQAYKNIYKGKRCFLIANGPSLKKMNLNFLKNEISFGLNRIYLVYDDLEFQNDYLISINKLVLSQFKDEIKTLSMPKFLNWQCRKLYGNDDSILYIHKSILGEKFGHDISKSSNPAATVTYAALQVIYYMGFSEVIIIGMDHNFKTKSMNRPNKTEVREEDEDENHFHPNYFPKGSKWETPDLISSDYFYKIAKNEFERDGRKIIDCTVNGQCDIFEKGNIEDYKN